MKRKAAALSCVVCVQSSHIYAGTCAQINLNYGSTVCPIGSLVQGFFKDNSYCADGWGCRGTLSKVSCCKCDSCQDPLNDPSNTNLTTRLTLPGDTNFWDSYNGLKNCSGGYFVGSIYTDTGGESEMKAWKFVNCTRPTNLGGAYLNATQYVSPPANFYNTGGWLLCPGGSFVTGLYTLPTGTGNTQKKDVMDFGLLCNFPQDQQCGTVSPPIDSFMTVVYNTVNGVPCRHQKCTAVQVCVPGYKANTTNVTLTCAVSGNFVGRPLVCNDMDECRRPCLSNETSGLQECHDCNPNARCTNTLGSKTCTCNPGWAGSGINCTNVNECGRTCSLTNTADTPEVGQCNNCTSNQTCVDNQGWFTCPCSPGFTTAACLDIDECAGPTCTTANQTQCNRCSSIASCANTIGSYTCTCPSGYTGNGFNCTDFNECATPCGPGVDTNCHTCQGLFNCSNTIGSFNCVCRGGYYQVGAECRNVNECANATQPCPQSTCVDTEGSYFCSPSVTFASISSLTLNSTALIVPGGTKQAPADTVLIVIQGMVAPMVWDNITNYGSVDNPTRYQATNCARSFSGATMNVTCLLAPGSGANLAFAFQYTYPGAPQQTLRATGKPFSYPVPTLLPNTLRQNGSATNYLTVQTVFGQSPLVTMDGTNLPVFASDAAVYFGSKPYVCGIETISSTSLSCRLAADGIGTNMTFMLIASAGNSQQIANGTDRLTTILVGPKIVNMTAVNCTTTTATTIANCPTIGTNILTVTTDQILTDPVLMLIAGGSCVGPVISPSNNKTFTCAMPPGSGVNLPTTFAYAVTPQFSSILKLVSYAAPSITAIQSAGCTFLSLLSIGNCPVAGGGTMTITGTNFGLDGAIVQLGQLSLAAQHVPGNEHSVLTVTLPSYASLGWIVSNDVVVVQGGGQGSNQPATLTFAPLCDAGNYETYGVCTKCAIGTFSIGVGKCSMDCLPCARGLFQPAKGSTSCQQCASGTFQPQAGASSCDPCPSGSYSIAAGEAGCAVCPVGRFSNAASSFCSACDPGQYQPATNQSVCLDCQAGTFTDIPEQVGCLDCPAGTTNGPAGSSCFACAPGRFNLIKGSNVCNPCAPGSFADQLGWAFDCLPCNAGRFQTDSGTTKCQDCDAGFEQPLTNQVLCTACFPGTYSAVNGQSSCSLCNAGTFIESRQATICSDCDVGYFQSVAGSSNCSACPIGQWNRNYRSSSCLSCTPGFYQNQLAQIACLPCAEGRYSTSEQASSCLPCSVAYSQSAQGQTFCQECSTGRFSDSTGSSSCALCAVGYFSAAPRVTACQACPPGTFQPFQGQVGCTVCPVGQSNNAPGAASCTNCGPGKYQADIVSPIECTPCPIGNASQLIAATSCEFCGVGKFSDHVGATICKDCVLGWVWDLSSTPPCKPCELGKFSDAQGLNCTSCAAGKFSDQASTPCRDCPAGSVSMGLGSTSCSACPAGKYAQTGQILCSPCPLNQYSPFANASLCFSCPVESIVDKQKASCLCDPGYYSVRTDAGQYSCQRCIKGMNCVDQGVTVSTLQTSAGFWRINGTFGFIRCPRQQYCMGGSATSNMCQSHRTGVLCGLCEPGYQANGASGVCEPCPEVQTSYTYSVLILLLMAFLLILMFYIVLRFSNMQQKSLREKINRLEQDDRINLEATLAKYNNQDVGQAENDNLEGEDAVDTSADFRELSAHEQKRVVRARLAEVAREAGGVDSDVFRDPALAAQKSAQRVLPSAESSMNTKELMKTRTSPNFMYKVKILVGFFQVATILPFQGGIQWPTAFAEFISIFAFLNFDFMPWESLGCVASITYYQKAIIVGCTPLLVLLLLLLFFYVPVWIHNTADTIQEQLVKQQKQAHLNRQFVKLTLFTVFLLYPFVSKTVLGVFNCIEVDGVSYLLADLSLICFDSNWDNYAVVCGLFVVMYPFGIPAAYLLLLRKANLRDPGTTFMLGFLYEAYVAKCYYWEIVDMLHKLVLTGIVAFAAANVQLVVNMAILVLYLEVLLWTQPYVRKGDDRFHLLVQIELYLLALVGWILTPPNAAELTTETDLLISLLLIGLTVFLMSSFIIIAGRNAYKLIKQRLLKKQTRALALSPSPSESEASGSGV